jgi:diadenosine tetraphosphate (Ap4A) HIT family hydrolase
MSFQLDTRLEADTYWMGDFHLSRVLLMNDRRYPWIILVPMLEGLKELTDLSEDYFAARVACCNAMVDRARWL